MAAADYASGMPISVKPIPKEVTYLFCAEKFHWPPDVVDRQDIKKLNGLIQMSSQVNMIAASMASRQKQRNSIPRDILE